MRISQSVLTPALLALFLHSSVHLGAHTAKGAAGKFSITEQDIIQIGKEAERADVVLVGQVISVGPVPKVWSGVITVFQTVEYRPLHLIRGPKLEKTSLTGLVRS
jgi:hypothetical protein